MAYNEYLADLVLQVLQNKNVFFEEKKMFGGLCFMVNDKMCIGIAKDKVMVRIDPEDYENLLEEPGAEPMTFTKKPMKGFLYINAEVIEEQSSLEKWIQRCLDFNPKAKSSKRKE